MAALDSTAGLLIMRTRPPGAEAWRLVMMMWSGAAIVAALTGAAGPELIGMATIAGDARDLSGLGGALGEGTPRDRLGSFGSGIAYTGRGNRFVAVDDRGPADGAAEFAARFQTLEIVATPGGSPALSVTLVSTTLLTDVRGEPLVGSTIAKLRYDAEAVRVSPGGTLWISEEYGPSVDEFSMDGRMIRRLAVPEAFQNDHPSPDPILEMPPHAKRGRQPNRGLEGLAVTPDGSKLVTILQGPLIEDQAVNERGLRIGVNLRLIEIDVQSGATRQFVYVMEGSDRGVNEILAVNRDQYLVLERDGKSGAAAEHRGLFLIDLRGATDVSGMESLPGTTLPEAITPVSKRLFLDLMNPEYGIAGASMPEKIEGLAFGPDLPDGRRLLIVTVDNDMRKEVPTTIYAFGVDASDLPGFEPQHTSGAEARVHEPGR